MAGHHSGGPLTQRASEVYEFLKRVTLIYHFFHPDNVVSARLFTELAVGLTQRGWKVDVLTSNRVRNQPTKSTGPLHEEWNGVTIERVTRPPFDQSKDAQRMANLCWMLGGWARQIRSRPATTYIVGTDPQFSQLLFPFIKAVDPANILVNWVFDLYPEALAADRPRHPVGRVADRLRPWMRYLYSFVDLMVDIGPVMRQRLRVHSPSAERATLVPWSPVEPSDLGEPDPTLRRQLFGEARLGLLYSGSLGRSHEFHRLLALARVLRRRTADIAMCFACRGARAGELRSALRPSDTNIRLAPFCDESEIEQRLVTADLHMLSLRSRWSGIAVPSKFFGSLATGRPVLYSGPADSDIGRWIGELDVGLQLGADNLPAVAERLVSLVGAGAQLRRWQRTAHRAYHRHFSKNTALDGWDRALTRLGRM